MYFQLDHQSERRWVLMLGQLEQTRTALRRAPTFPFAAYRDQIIRAVTGNKPAMVFRVVDNTKLAAICDHLVDAEKAFSVLRAKGHGKPGMLLSEVAALVANKE